MYPGDADGTYRPVSDHGHRGAARRLPRLPRPQLLPRQGHRRRRLRRAGAGLADRPATGLPVTNNPRWAYDQPNVDFWHSATFSWDGKVANFIDESFGDGCPTMTTRPRPAGRAARVRDGEHVLLRDAERRAAVGVPQPAPDERRREPDHGQVLLLAPRHPGAGEGSLPAGERLLPRRLLGDRLHQPEEAEGGRVRRPRRHEHLVGVHLPAEVGAPAQHPGVLEQQPRRNYGTAASPRYPEAAYGFMRFQADVPADLVGFDHLNPQLQERVIRMKRARGLGPGRAGALRQAASLLRRARSTARRGRWRSRTTRGPARAGPPTLAP